MALAPINDDFVFAHVSSPPVVHIAAAIGRISSKWLSRYSNSSLWSLRDIGFVEQADIFDAVAQRLGHAPPVVDADDVLKNPRGVLNALCKACGIAFDEDMLIWPKGAKSFDGVWAPHWYNAVWESTDFAAPVEKTIDLPSHLAKIADEARGPYLRLKTHSLVGVGRL